MTEPNKAKGCSAAVIFIVIGVLVVLAIPVLFFSMFIMKRARVSERQHMQAELAHSPMAVSQSSADLHEVHFKQGYPRRSIAEIGDELSRESFIEFTMDSNTTSLGRDTFIMNANGRTVRWLMRVKDITAATDGGLSGHFEMPYKIHSENGYTGSSVSIHAMFPASEKIPLTRLCRNDWITVEGRLEIKHGYEPSLHEAKVVEAEK